MKFYKPLILICFLNLIFLTPCLSSISKATPIPDIKANNSNFPLTLNTSGTLSVTVSLSAESSEGVNADWWVVAKTACCWYYYVYPTGWFFGPDVSDIQPTYQGALFTISPFEVEVLNISGLPAGTYLFYFGVDTVMNGVIDFDHLFYDSVSINVNDSGSGGDVGSWSILTIDTIGYPPIVSNSLALDDNNKVHICYSDFVKEEVKYATNTAGLWDIYVIDTTNINKYGDVSIAVDSKGAVHIIYNGEGSLKYTTNSSGSWVAEVIDSLKGENTSISMVVDLNDNIHISYPANNTDIISYPVHNKEIRYATNASGSWVVSTIYSSESMIENISLALDSLNNAHLSFYKYDYVNYLNVYDSVNYLTNVSGSWSARVIDSEIGASGYYSGGSSISIDSKDKVHISYNNVGNGTLKYATNTSGSWVVSELGGLQGWGTSLAIDSLDKIHITSWELNNLDLIYITNVSGEWTAELVDTEGNAGEKSRIKIDSEDKIHISYLSTLYGSYVKLKYAFK